MSTAKVQIEIEARTAKAVGEMGKFTAATAKAKAGSEAAGAATTKMTLAMGAGIAAAATGAAITLDKLSSRALALTDVNRNLTISLDAATRATGGMVSQFDLARNANTALRFGVVKTSEDFAKHVEIATKLARSTGGDATKAVEDLTTALARQSPQILDNLGLQVDVEKANAEYARSIGKTAAALTEAEKKQAFMNAAMADAEVKVGSIAVATDGWAAALQRAKTAIFDTADSVLLLDENTSALAREIETSSTAGNAFVETLRWIGRELENPAQRIAEMPGLMDVLSASIDAQSRKYRELGQAAKDTAASQAQAAANTAAYMQALGIAMSGVAPGITALTNEADSQYFANADAAAAKSRGGGRGRRGPAFDALALGDTQNRFGREDTREFEGERALAEKSAIAGQMQRVGEVEKEAMAKAEEERLKRLEEAKDAAADADKKRHAEEMKRLAMQQARYEKAGAAIGDSVATVAASWLLAGDLSTRGFAKALAGWGRTESIKLGAIAISEGVQALVSLATFNPAGAALHSAAAAQATVGAGLVAAMTAAVGGFGSINKNVGGGFGGDAFGPGSEPVANDRPSSTNAQQDTTPVSEGRLQQSGGAHLGPARRGSGTVVNVNGLSVLGAIDDQSARRIATAIKRAGDNGGRLTG